MACSGHQISYFTGSKVSEFIDEVSDNFPLEVSELMRLLEVNEADSLRINDVLVLSTF